MSMLSDSADISIPGFKTRHLVELNARDWDDLILLVQSLKTKGHIAYFRTNTRSDQNIDVALGVENISGQEVLRELHNYSGLQNLQIEHLLVNMASH